MIGNSMITQLFSTASGVVGYQKDVYLLQDSLVYTAPS